MRSLLKNRGTEASGGAEGAGCMAEVNVRAAGPSDLPTIVGFSEALFREDAGTRDPVVNLAWARESGAAYFAERLAAGAALTLIADADGAADAAGVAAPDAVARPVGYLTGYLRDADGLRTVPIAELESMFVDPALRGQEVGARLVGAFVEWSRERGARRVAVSAYAANDGAVRFYRRHGFEPMNVSFARTL